MGHGPVRSSAGSRRAADPAVARNLAHIGVRGAEDLLGGFVQGIAHFEALVDVDGYLLPARVTVTPGLGDDVATDGLHTMVFTDAAFDVGP